MAARIGLAEAIEQLRTELGEAQDAGADQQLRFEVTEVEVEFLVELRKEGSAKASFGVLAIGAEGNAEGKIARGSTHRLTLRLNVMDAALGSRHLEFADEEAHPWDE
ncbi:hypothetical protein GCM10009677_15270 [Sphaerisporangium rubeum]|uniref:Trypsin-co-occurring domain-containing protein n=1 Tax=Sphaerisporangium rubeum TaxID=321317 RepID=A0A7X0I9H0_9ACTN|nr:trypco2 family protein [Sphaerisporangium rubeum]MBB6471086.1 hypothetical protein [Sphaerisporangium rubeum]